jgi:hypothetical protein
VVSKVRKSAPYGFRQDKWRYDKDYGDVTMSADIREDDDGTPIIKFFALMSNYDRSQSSSGAFYSDPNNIDPKDLCAELIKASSERGTMRKVLTPEIVDDFLHDPQTTHLIRGMRHKDSWDRAVDLRDADTQAAIKELLAMWQTEHPLKVGSVVISDVLPKRPVWTISDIDGKVAEVVSSDGRSDEVPLSKLYADDRDLEKLVRQGDSLSAATLKKLARKLDVEDIVADLFNP